MPRFLISFDELGDALGRIPAMELDGQKYLDGNMLLHAITVLVRGEGVSTRAELRSVPENAAERALVDAKPTMTERFDAEVEANREKIARDINRMAYVEPEPLTDDERRQRASEQHQFETLEEARAQLAALPPGECVGCKHHAHYNAHCIVDMGNASTCPCTDYVDSVERDPVEVAREAMLAGSPPPGWWVPEQPAIQSMISHASENERHLMFDRPVRDL